MLLRVAVYWAAFFQLVVGQAWAQEISSLFVEYDETAEAYQYIDARMDETATAAVFFGLVGAAVNSAQNINQDEERGSRFADAAESLDVLDIVRTSMLATLEGRDIALLDNKKKASHRLLVEIGDWGLRRRSGETTEMRSYVNVRMVLRDHRGRELDRKIVNRVGDMSSANLIDFENGDFEKEVTAAAEAAGQQIAYDLIYR